MNEIMLETITTTISWIVNNWGTVLILFVLLEKVVKLSPTKYDDIILDMVIKPIFYAIKGGK